MRNVEVKARVGNLEQLLAAAKSLADSDKAAYEMRTCDTFFNATTGRLKLREYMQPADRVAQLIHYSRQDTTDAKLSDYSIAEVPDCAAMRQVLADALGVVGCVRKHRVLLMRGNTRIHIDCVEGLGNFMELEVVPDESQSVKEGQATADEIMQLLSIPNEDRIANAYMDLILNKAA